MIWSLVLFSPAATAEESIASRRAALDAREFDTEKQAQRHGAVITAWWDALRGTDDFPSVAKDYPVRKFQAPVFGEASIWRSAFGEVWMKSPTGGTEQTATGDASLLVVLSEFYAQGWRLEESEWHHLRFEPAELDVGRGAVSTVNVTLHARKNQQRVILRGLLKVWWMESDEATAPRLERLDASGLSVWQREGEVPFKVVEELLGGQVGEGGGGLHPIIVEDLDGDGFAEVALGGANLLLSHGGDMKWQQRPLMPFPDPISSGAALADFDGDGQVDILAVSKYNRRLTLYRGVKDWRRDSDSPPFRDGTRCRDIDLPAAQVISVADVDADGDLDIFLGQYMPPYQGGIMPEPFYDANDGHPSYLLLNNGRGRFDDATEGSGIAGKRHRRVYAASFIDLDKDSHLDLMLTSDFAGVDVFSGDGKGGFVDRTSEWVTQPRLFGMSQVFGDFNRDGFSDVMAVGMASTTARRLEQMGLGLEKEKEITAQRAAMGYGNRLYLGGDAGQGYGLREPKYAHDLAESGWSWGAAAVDLDNNGWRDLYIANGHVSGKSASDYCSTFWRHDIYTPVRASGDSSRAEWQSHFAREMKQLVDYETSWNGYEHNVAFLQREEGKFDNISYLLGLSQEGDSRAVVSADFDRDGDMDLLVTVLEPGKEIVHRLLIYENGLAVGKARTGWLGIDLDEPLNAVVTLTRSEGSKETAVVTSGGSFCSQMPGVVHFGLGEDKAVQAVDVLWPDGTSKSIAKPGINRWHRISKK